jgi:hypothetical protein
MRGALRRRVSRDFSDTRLILPVLLKRTINRKPMQHEILSRQNHGAGPLRPSKCAHAFNRSARNFLKFLASIATSRSSRRSLNRFSVYQHQKIHLRQASDPIPQHF